MTKKLTEIDMCVMNSSCYSAKIVSNTEKPSHKLKKKFEPFSVYVKDGLNIPNLNWLNKRILKASERKLTNFNCHQGRTEFTMQTVFNINFKKILHSNITLLML